jgi:hypothetical protein
LGFVADVVRRHGALLCAYRGSEAAGMQDLRKHLTWYFKGYPVGAEVRAAGRRLASLADLDALLGSLDRAAPWPEAADSGPRGRAGGVKRVVLPDGWLDSREVGWRPGGGLPAAAEIAVSGG